MTDRTVLSVKFVQKFFKFWSVIVTSQVDPETDPLITPLEKLLSNAGDDLRGRP